MPSPRKAPKAAGSTENVFTPGAGRSPGPAEPEDDAKGRRICFVSRKMIDTNTERLRSTQQRIEVTLMTSISNRGPGIFLKIIVSFPQVEQVPSRVLVSQRRNVDRRRCTRL